MKKKYDKKTGFELCNCCAECEEHYKYLHEIAYHEHYHGPAEPK